MIRTKAERSGIAMSEDEETAQRELNGALPPDEPTPDPDDVWRDLQERGLVTGPRPNPADRVRTSELRPIRYHGANEDLLRDLGRSR